jgi:hypothetical protein
MRMVANLSDFKSQLDGGRYYLIPLSNHMIHEQVTGSRLQIYSTVL